MNDLQTLGKWWRISVAAAAMLGLASGMALQHRLDTFSCTKLVKSFMALPHAGGDNQFPL